MNTFKVVNVWVVPEDNDSLEKNLLQLHTNTWTKNKYETVKEKQNEEEKDANSLFKAFFITEDNDKRIYKIGSYKIVPRNRMIEYLLDSAHKSTKSHLKKREMREYLWSKLNVSWPKKYEECEGFCKDWESCQMFQRVKNSKVYKIKFMIWAIPSRYCRTR